MIKSVNNYPVSQLFDIEAGVVYAIPRYQREYTWKIDQWESLFDDIEENDPGYFLGSIICINQTTDKRDRTDSKGREVGYKNGLKLNAELATAEAWSVKQIDARTTTLVDQVVSLFAMTEGQPCA